MKLLPARLAITAYDIRLEYAHFTNDARVALSWAQPGARSCSAFSSLLSAKTASTKGARQNCAMKTKSLSLPPWGLTLYAAFALGGAGALGQGTISFNAGAGLSSTYYQERGMWFEVVIPPGTGSYDNMVITYGAGNTPRNGTAFMGWFRQYNPYNHVSISLPNGALFGLTSVDLADPASPSPSPVAISFVGHLGGGSTVTNTFVTPGNGATTFANYTFNPDFTAGLTRVDILAPRWAMDNLVWVPEPSAISLVLLGGGVFMYARNRRRMR